MIAPYLQKQDHKINEWIKSHNIKLNKSHLVYNLVTHRKRYCISLSKLDKNLDRFGSRKAVSLNDVIVFFNQSIFRYERALQHYNTVIKYLKYESEFPIYITGYSTEELALLKKINYSDVRSLADGFLYYHNPDKIIKFDKRDYPYLADGPTSFLHNLKSLARFELLPYKIKEF